LWTLRALLAVTADWTPVAVIRELWRDYRFHRVSLTSLTPVVYPSTSGEASFTFQSNPDMRIAGEHHEALICSGNSLLSFQTAVDVRARLVAYCAVMPRVWDSTSESWNFTVMIAGSNDSNSSVHKGSATLTPGSRVSDRRWRSLRVRLPSSMTGTVTVTLRTEARVDAAMSDSSAAWGDVALEWPRSRSERRRLLRRALQWLRWSGLRQTTTYALGRRRLEDQAATYTRWAEARELDEHAVERLRQETAEFEYRPLISIVTPVHNTPASVLEACLASVRGQAYSGWQHCIVDDASTSEETRKVLERVVTDPRVNLVRLERNMNISAAQNAALKRAKGDFVAFLDHDDELAPEALAEVVRYLNTHRDVDVVYSIEDKLDERGRRCDPHFKPDWSPELLLSYMYPCHLMVIRRELLEEIGGFRVGLEGAQDYDLLLRLTERTENIGHIPRVLYHWRKSESSTAAGETNKLWAVEAGARALEDHARRTGTGASVLPGPSPGMYRFQRVIRGQPLVSIVIPTTGWPTAVDGGPLTRCLRSLAATDYRHFEVVVATDAAVTAPVQEALQSLPHRIVECAPDKPFNFSRKINEAVRQTSGEHIVLFNDDLEVMTPGWLAAMLEYSQESPIGAVGAKLLYPDGRLQHIGMLVGVCGIASHAFYRWAGHSTGYVGVAVVGRNCSAVTAACLMTRRVVFDQVGGFDEALPVDLNDVDFCLRVRAAGYRIVFTPYAELVHHESASIGRRLQSPEEFVRMRERWGDNLERDPYYNSNLSRNFSDYRLQA